ncbi:peptidase C14, caspase catalytic subunit p20 [Bradyrhizobium guangdongense]|uniref:caspase family protein n=1 Tax=Bradyrhizobium guangdongense TaxID=1325090 RepID=UPI001128EC16|nr:caspase family protein [Bradyrhizobium guangdongense]TPQ37387.1 peptidase C14, caspase catalytic subunit p20 [Bradyrhizobium guangdongense]
MHRLLLAAALLAAALWSAPCLAQARNQLGPLCTTNTTPADQMIDACTKIIALKVFQGEKLAGIYFWRSVAWTKKADYSKVILDATESLRLFPNQAAYNQRGTAYHAKGEYDIAIADYDDALKLGPPDGTIHHNRGNSYRLKGDYDKAIADYDASIKISPSALTFQNRGISKQALGDLDGALADINQAIRLDPMLAQPLIHRTTIWRAKGDFDRAIADGTEAIRLATDKPPVNFMTPPNSVLITAYTFRGLTYEAKGDFDHAKADFRTALSFAASDAGSKANQASAKVRLSLLSEPTAPAQKANATPAPSPVPAGPGKRMALIIGNGAYSHVKALPNPPNDARAVAKSLRNIGFTVSEGIDLDRAAMQTITRDFLRDAARAQVAVVYYAGHGVQVDGRNYLIPVDVELKPGASMTEAMIDMDTIMAGLDDQVRTNILIFDACRNNPMAPQVATAGTNRAIEGASGLAAPTSLGAGATLGAGTLIAFATAPGQVALDGEGANSPFSAALSHHIGTRGLEVQQMLTRVRAEVVSGTKNKQVPWSNSSLLGEVYLAEK